MKNIYNSLKKGGYLIHQNSSGNKENCELRSALVNIPELGRAGAGSYHWVSEEEYLSLAEKAGFSKTVQVGYAQANSWGPEDQWDRFNSEMTRVALDKKDQEALFEIETRKKSYLEKANKLIKEYSDKYGKDYLQIKEVSKGKILIGIGYSYPIIVSRK